MTVPAVDAKPADVVLVAERDRLRADDPLAGLVGLVQGGSQALSRSVFATLIPRDRTAEFFGFFSVFEKFAGIAGPALFAASVSMFGSSRAAVVSVILFFVAGALVLTRVNVAEGEAQVQGVA